jgi:hypothetical protein
MDTPRAAAESNLSGRGKGEVKIKILRSNKNISCNKFAAPLSGVDQTNLLLV